VSQICHRYVTFYISVTYLSQICENTITDLSYFFRKNTIGFYSVKILLALVAELLLVVLLKCYKSITSGSTSNSTIAITPTTTGSSSSNSRTNLKVS